MLQLVPPPPPEKEPWEQQPGEPDDLFAWFSWWLHKTPRPGVNERYAGEWRWAERAKAFDQVTSNPRGYASQFESVYRDLMTILTTGMRRLAKRVIGGEELTPKETLQLAMWYHTCRQEIDAVLAELVDIDTSKIPGDKLEKLEEARKILREYMQAVPRLGPREV